MGFLPWLEQSKVVNVTVCFLLCCLLEEEDGSMGDPELLPLPLLERPVLLKPLLIINDSRLLGIMVVVIVVELPLSKLPLVFPVF